MASAPEHERTNEHDLVSRHIGRGAALLAGFVIVTAVLATGVLDGVDIAVRDWCDAHRPLPLYRLSRRLNHLGSANLLVVVALGLAVVAAARLRSWWPLLPVAATYAVSHLVLGPVKVFTHRAAPRSPRWDAVSLFAAPDGWSYPSGHVVNAVIWFQVFVLLVNTVLRSAGRGELSTSVRRVLRVAPVVSVSVTVTYPSFHWLTDTIAALLLGGFIAGLLARVPWPRLPAWLRSRQTGRVRPTRRS